MLVDESIAAIVKTAKFLKEADPGVAPVLATPQWFLDEVRQAHGEPPGSVVESIGGCAVVLKDDIDEPSVISGAGQVYRVLPQWARAAKRVTPPSTDQLASGKKAFSSSAAISSAAS